MLPGDTTIPQVVHTVVWAGVDRHGHAGVEIGHAPRVIGPVRTKLLSAAMSLY
jgi:hypothetical protein